MYEDFHYDSPAAWDREAAREMGHAEPHRAWILTDRDAWYPNPFYQGPPVPHPESYDGEADGEPTLFVEDDYPF
jgi:hypothetical protein